MSEATSSDTASLLGLNPDAVPLALRESNRWAPWVAKYDAKRGKFDKVPRRAERPEWGLSTANPQKWASFAAAVAAHKGSDGMTQGVGYCMTTPHGIVGVDLDDATTGGQLDDWAAEIVERLGGYAELSPSGRGVRVFVRGEVAADWTNHAAGVEVYAGHTPRFLTVTGRRIRGSGADATPAPPGALEWLAEKYRTTARAASVPVDIPPIPEIEAPEFLPTVAELEIPPRAREFLAMGDYTGDRSHALHSTAVSLFAAGHSAAEVFSILANNPHALEVALDHRRQDHDRALVYLWVHHCVNAQPKVVGRLLTMADFEDFDALGAGYDASGDLDDADEPQDAAQVPSPAPAEREAPPADPARVVASADDFDDLTEGEPAAPAKAHEKPKAQRFEFMHAAAYVGQRRRLSWLVPGVLPQADLCAVFGESGSGKTFFTLDLVARIACGLSWWGRSTRQTRVAYIAAEGAVGFQDRITAWCRQNAIDPADVDLYVLGDQPNLLEKEDVKDLVRQLRRLAGVGLVVVDTLAQVTPGASENSSEDMGRALAHARAIRKATGATVLLVGHSGKDAGRGLRGWSGIKGALDAEIEVTRTAAYRAARITKLKDGRGEGEEYLFNLHTFALDFDTEAGEEITSCVIEPLDKAQRDEAKQKAKVSKLGDNQQTILTLAQNMIGFDDAPVKEQTMLDAAKKTLKAQGVRGDSAKRSLEDLIKAGLLVLADGWVSLPPLAAD